MSVISQFFPSAGSSSGGGGGGSEVAIGGGTTPVEIIGVSGGGGGGGDQNASSVCTSPGFAGGGHGGMGAIFVATNYCITPGVTYPITIGTGGNTGSPTTQAFAAQQGFNGGDTSFNNPLCQLHVLGGGGGGGGAYNSLASAPPTEPEWTTHGQPGGTGGSGGGSGCAHPATGATYRNSDGGEGAYYTRKLIGETIDGCYLYGSNGPQALAGAPMISHTISSHAETLKCPWGFKGGFPAACGTYSACCSLPAQRCYVRNGCGGGSMSNTDLVVRNGAYCVLQSFLATVCDEIGYYARFYTITWQGLDNYKVGFAPGSAGYAGVPTQNAGGGNGCPGGLWIRYPDAFAAASSFPGGTDLSPNTPGYRTYCFSGNGSITI